MSWSERSVRHHKRHTDDAIHAAYARLATEALARATFHKLLNLVRIRAARLLEAPVLNGYHPGVEALVNLSRFERSHIRAASEWPGTTSSWRPAVSSLAHHLVCRYTIPRFLASSWYSPEGAAADTKRRWFVAHASGVSFRSLDLPIAMTRKMEHIFLASHDHLAIEIAMRRAELLALGASADIVQAVLSTPLATDLDHGEFWRTVWMFLIANSDTLAVEQIGPIIDYIQAIRHQHVTIETPNGNVDLDPPQPAFSIKGRTVQSMLRLMADWHRSLGSGSGGFTWTPSPLRPLLIEEPSQDDSIPPKVWHLMELTDSAALRSEGAALHHCVATYAGSCSRGNSRIWSLRSRRGDHVRHVLTIEVDPKMRAIVQARGWANRMPSGKVLQILEDWAARERLKMAI